MCTVKAMVFRIVMYGCELWTIKKAEYWRINAFILSCWRRLFRVPCKVRRSNQSILKEINAENSLEKLMQKWSSNNSQTVDSLEKTLMLRRRGRQDEMVGWITDSFDVTWVNCEMLRHREAWCAAVHGVTKSETWLGEWTKECMYNLSTWPC